MSRVRVAGFGISLDGFSAGIEQSLEDPLGQARSRDLSVVLPYQVILLDARAGRRIYRCGRRVRTAVDGKLWRLHPWSQHFGPVRGPWQEHTHGRDGWGTNPPYHAPTFVLTHHEREPLVMEGGRTFYFVSGGIEEALRLAKQAAGHKDVKIGGGVSTRAAVSAGWADRFLHFALVTRCPRS